MAENLNNPAEETAAPEPGILVGGHFNQPFGYQTLRSQGTKDWLITFTLSGCGRFQLGQRLFECTAGDIVLLPPGVPHHYYTPENSKWEFVWAHFLPMSYWLEWMVLSFEPEGLVLTTVESVMQRARVEAAFQRMIRDSVELGYFQNKLSLNALEEILLLLVQLQSRQASGSLDPRIHDILQHLNRHMKEPHRIEDLAARASLSPSRLAHLFKEQVGDSIIDTLLRLRLRQATRLLEHTQLSITEIAEEVGFNNPFYFTKQFTSLYGLSPSHYRKKMKPQLSTPDDSD
jgi:AraC family transcriptional regulator of arabinose operon